MLIDIVLISGITASDGSIVDSGAIVKFSTEFPINSTNVLIRTEMYRSREIFEFGYRSIESNVIPSRFSISIPDEEFFTITPLVLFNKVKDYLNNHAGGDFFEIVVLGEEENE